MVIQLELATPACAGGGGGKSGGFVMLTTVEVAGHFPVLPAEELDANALDGEFLPAFEETAAALGAGAIRIGLVLTVELPAAVVETAFVDVVAPDDAVEVDDVEDAFCCCCWF